jgi:hypothetical protein
MTAIADLVKNTRYDIIGDIVEPYLWTDEDLTRYANNAIMEACDRMNLITKSSNVSVTATTPTYTINSTIKQILVAKLDLGARPLEQTTDAWLSIYKGSNWRTRNGTPTHFIKDKSTVTLYPNPIANDTLVIASSNYPGVGFSLDTDINPIHYDGLMYYIAYLVLRTSVDTLPILGEERFKNPLKALEYLALFDAYFGRKKSAKYRQFAQDTPIYGRITGGKMC